MFVLRFPTDSQQCTAVDPTAYQLVLSEHMRWAVSAPPVAVAATDSDNVWFLSSHDRRLYRLAHGGVSAASAEPDTGFSVLAPGRGRVLGVNDRHVFAHHREGERHMLATLPESLGRILAIAETRGGLWVVADQRDVSSLYSIALSGIRNNPRLVGSWPGNAVRLHTTDDDRLLLAAMRPPFAIQLLTERQRFRWLVAEGLPTSLIADTSVSADALSAVAALPLNCRSTLHVLADRRSDKRFFVLYDRTARVRVRTIESPIGFTQVLSPNLLLGYDDTGGQEAVVLYQFEWSLTQYSGDVAR